MNLEYVRAWVTWRPFSLPDRAVPRSFCHTPISFSSSSGGQPKKFYHFWSAPLGPLAGSGPNKKNKPRIVTVRDSTKLGKENIAAKNIQNICNIKQFSRTLWAAKGDVFFRYLEKELGVFASVHWLAFCVSGKGEEIAAYQIIDQPFVCQNFYTNTEGCPRH